MKILKCIVTTDRA